MEKSHKTNIIAMIIFMMSVLLIVYILFYYPLLKHLKSLQSQILILNEQVDIKRKMTESFSKGETRKIIYVDSIQDFLKRINNIGNEASVIIRKMEPLKDTSSTYRIDIIANYYSFLKFICGLESLNIDIQDLSVHPYSFTEHVISFTIAPLEGGKSLENEHIKEITQQINKPNLRNPFKAYVVEGLKPPEQLVDLTWKYKLTSIGMYQGVKEATIDQKVVHVGNAFPDNTKRIVQLIEDDRVYFIENKSWGKEYSVIEFRIKNINNTKDTNKNK